MPEQQPPDGANALSGGCYWSLLFFRLSEGTAHRCAAIPLPAAAAHRGASSWHFRQNKGARHMEAADRSCAPQGFTMPPARREMPSVPGYPEPSILPRKYRSRHGFSFSFAAGCPDAGSVGRRRPRVSLSGMPHIRPSRSLFLWPTYVPTRQIGLWIRLACVLPMQKAFPVPDHPRKFPPKMFPAGNAYDRCCFVSAGFHPAAFTRPIRTERAPAR